MDPNQDEHAPDTEPEIAPDLTGPAYPLQPEDGERPIPLRRMPERTQDPGDWDVASAEPSTPREPDHVAELRRVDEEEARLGTNDERDSALTAGTEHESGYSTELEQGAAQPRPDGSEFRPRDDG